MGYMRHHAIVVTGPEAAYKEADSPFDVSIGDVWGQTLRIAEHHTCSQLVSPILNSLINHSGSFFIAPDGSKEGWTHSAIGDKFRADVIAYLDSLRYEDGSTSFDYAEIQFGDDNKETKVTAASDFSAAQPGKKEGQ